MAIKVHIHKIFNRIITPIKAFVLQCDEFCQTSGPNPNN